MFITELEVLAYFDYHITFLLQNYVEKCSQSDLVQILPKLHQDLLDQKVDTLQNFVLSMRSVPVTEPIDTGKRILGEMCTETATALKLQCGRKYGFSDDKVPWATVLSTLSSLELEGLSTNNLIAERYFSKFNCLSTVFKCRNRKFTTKGIHDNMILFNSSNIRAGKITKKVSNVL